MTTTESYEYVKANFPTAVESFKMRWLDMEQNLRKALTLDMPYEDRLLVIDQLIGIHTGRGTELAPRN